MSVSITCKDKNFTKKIRNNKKILIPLSSDIFVKCLNKLISEGYCKPYVTDKNDNGKPGEHSLCLTKESKEKKEKKEKCRMSKKSVFNKILYVLEQYKNEGGCYMYARFTDNALNFLKDSTENGHTENSDGSKSQKEIAGELMVGEIEKNKKGQLVFLIDVDKKSLITGKEEDINISPSRYNFHSHPRGAYVRHNVKIGWPSMTDYLGVLSLGTRTIFHVIATLEGIYIVSLSGKWCKKTKEISVDFIKNNYDINKNTTNLTPQQYIQKVNSINYKNSSPIFDVRFLEWGNEARTIFRVDYGKQGINCSS